jgi:[acyl-carrier-protein] S-malonyltransferase
VSHEDGLRLVALRGKLMNDAQTETPGTMAAVIGLDADRLTELCTQASSAGLVAPANLNTPAQIVVSGEVAGVERLMELAREAGADKVVPLQVGAAFHSELMKPVQEKMAEAMNDVAWNDPEVPLASNASGMLATTGDDVHQALVAQIASPVLWVDCVENLVENGVDHFLELGSGRVLMGLVRQVNPDVEPFAADSPKKLAKFKERAGA